MTRYVVAATSAEGRRPERLVLDAGSVVDAARLARAQGYLPLRIRAQQAGWRAWLDAELSAGARLGLGPLA